MKEITQEELRNFVEREVIGLASDIVARLKEKDEEFFQVELDAMIPVKNIQVVRKGKLVWEEVSEEEAEELQNLLERETGYQFTTSFDWIRFSKKSWTQHYDFDEKSNDIVSEFALALVKVAKQVRKEKLSNLKENMQNIMSEIGGI